MATHLTSNVGAALLRRGLLLVAGLVATLFTGCLEADPMPTPGRPDRDKILVSSSDLTRDGGPVGQIGLIGLSSAAPEEGEIVIRQIQTDTVTIAKVAANGAFSAVVSGAAGDRLSLVFRVAEGTPESNPVEVDVAAYDKQAAPGTPSAGGANDAGGTGSATGTPTPTLRTTTPTATAPDGRGRVTVTGENLDAGELLAIGNVRTGEVVEVTAGTDGKFSATLAAAPGDTLVVIARNPQTGATSGMASLSVASP